MSITNYVKRLFVIEGVVTFVVTVVAMWLLLDSPLTTRWLTPEERTLVSERINRNTVGLSLNKGAMAGLKQALRDPILYIFAFI